MNVHQAAGTDSRADRGPGRLEQLEPECLDPDQPTLYAYLRAVPVAWAEEVGFLAMDPAGRLLGPFDAFLHSPVISRSDIDLMQAERAAATLSAREREVVILTVGSLWQSGYGIYAHTAAARSTGLSDDVIAAVLGGEVRAALSEREAAAQRFVRRLIRDRQVDNVVFAVAEGLFGARGLVTVSDRVPLGTLPGAAGVCLSCPSCSMISSFDVVSTTVLVNCMNSPFRAVQDRPCPALLFMLREGVCGLPSFTTAITRSIGTLVGSFALLRRYACLVSMIRQVLARVFVDDIETALPLYQALSADDLPRHFEYGHVRLCWMGSFLLIEVPPGERPRFERVATLVVADIESARRTVEDGGGVILEGPAPAPNGARMIARHGDGAVFEYIES